METATMLLRNFQMQAPFEIREGENGTRIITGKPIVFNQKTNLGYFEEIIERGALDGADLSDVRFLVNHDTSKIPLARAKANNANSTMTLQIEDDGLRITVILDVENNADARALFSAIQRGDITGMSFMFGIDKEEWENLDSDLPTRHIKAISIVVEVSAVTFPAYEGTEISARSNNELARAKELAKKAKEEAEKTKRDFKTDIYRKMYALK